MNCIILGGTGRRKSIVCGREAAGTSVVLSAAKASHFVIRWGPRSCEARTGEHHRTTQTSQPCTNEVGVAPERGEVAVLMTRAEVSSQIPATGCPCLPSLHLGLPRLLSVWPLSRLQYPQVEKRSEPKRLQVSGPPSHDHGKLRN